MTSCQQEEAAGPLRGSFEWLAAATMVIAVTAGFGIWALARATGHELALEWAVITFTMNDIPFIGPPVARLFPTSFAGLEFGTWQMMITVFLGMNAIRLVLGSCLEPRISGRIVSVSPFAMRFAVFMGGLPWGVAGAFLGPPILIALLTFCERSVRFWRLAAALASRPPQRTSPR
ncbi:AI-2E family transporter [Elioraea thermophila]|uniref:AI-2E family transporter n=1 Tax=Elioraea thermophila TaxID=2185104 RepID=UPI0022B80C60|nr:AI-2E family transporter [Elioraea thermophila]